MELTLEFVNMYIACRCHILLVSYGGSMWGSFQPVSCREVIVLIFFNWVSITWSLDTLSGIFLFWSLVV